MRTADGADPCQLYQLLQDSEGNNVAEVSMFALPAGQQAVAGATIVAPLETLLTEQLTISVDGAQPKRYPFTWCAPVGCIARVGFTQAEIDGFKKGAKATIMIVPAGAPNERVNLDLSLKGFTAGFDAVSKTPAQ
jgi:invasion protein IalB